MLLRNIEVFAPSALLLATSQAATTPFCKCDPTSPQWPSVQQWQALNVSVSGALQVPVAFAEVCRPDQPTFNNITCYIVAENRTNTDWVARNSWAVDYNDDTCLPNATAPCSTAGYPAYVVEANSADDVAAGVKFAKDNQVRLIVKGTGHDYPGRSSGPGSLSIWTHKLQGVQVAMGDAKAIQYGGVAAVKISAGMRWGEIYTEAAKHNLTVMGGADPNVGVGGWITGGGHGPLTSKYGMGADQVLEMDVVTADGQILTINETSHEDLFWAMRGGGGSTFAVILNVTVKAYPSVPTTFYLFAYNTTSYSETYWSAAAHFHAALPGISEAGGMGYYYILPAGISLSDSQGTITGVWLFPEKTEEQVKQIMAPLEQSLNNASWATDKIVAGGETKPAPDFTSAWLYLSQPESGGTSGRLGSWLLDGPALSSNITAVNLALQKAAPEPWPLLGHLVSGPGSHSVTVPGGSNAVLPAWRKAYVHLVAARSWTPLNTTLKNALTSSLRSEIIPALKALAPESGAYMNEADPSNPDWKNDYYGANYQRLLEVKTKWDPDGVFWCKPCVGNDAWDVVFGPQSEDELNWGIAQVGGKICQTE